MFFCKKCSTEKPETEWYYSVRGRDSMCKFCRKEYRKGNDWVSNITLLGKVSTKRESTNSGNK